MNPRILILLGGLVMAVSAPLQAANECEGTPYRRTGASCAELGLDTNRAICVPGRRFAVMCDDAVGGRVRTCSSNIRCDGNADRDDRRGHGDRRHDNAWRDHDDRRHDNAWRDHDDRRFNDGFFGDFFGGRGNRNDDTVYFHGDRRACQTLRFDRYGEPVGYCARGTLNRDCRGGCERW